MLRQGLRRCAHRAGSAASASMLLRSRPALSVARQDAAAAAGIRPISHPLKAVALAGRAFSTDASAAAEAHSEAAAPGEVTRFRELDGLGVHSRLISTIADDMGFETMTPVQSKTINPALKGTDIVAQAKTGTGKTIAFLLPVLQRMIDEDPSLASRGASRQARSDDIRGIVLSPTRELAAQIAAEAQRLTRGTGLVVQLAVGGTDRRSMLSQTQRQGCHLLIATPGRLCDLLEDPSTGIAAPNLAAMVLDEADRMLDVGFEQELNVITDMLPRPEDKVRQTMLVSATIPDNVIRLARSMVRADDFEFVQTIPETESLTHDKVPQRLVSLASWANAFPTVFELIDTASEEARNTNGQPFKAIVYFNTTNMVQFAGELGTQRRQDGYQKLPSFVIHSRLTQNQRTRAADMFRRARSGVLFSSDVTARGMDFPDVTHVIQVDAPRDREPYIHRLGRTGRQDKYGEGWLILPPSSVRSARRILHGLPLELNNSLTSASYDFGQGGELPRWHQEQRALSERMPRQAAVDAYLSSSGAAIGDKSECMTDMGTLITDGLGWEQTPAVSLSWANKMGIDSSALNIQSSRFGGGERGSRSLDRSGGRDFDRSRSGGRGFGRRPSDPFDSVRDNVRRDDYGGGFGRPRF